MIIIKKLILISLFLLPISISSFKYKKTTFFISDENIQKKDNTVIVHIKDKDLYLDLEDYVVGVVSAEMPALFNDEALKAQAVASRSYALSKMNNNIIEISSTISDQVYQQNYELKNKWQDNYIEYYNKILTNVLDTKGEVVSRGGKILKTYYFSMSNGKTENSKNVFNETTFLSVDSPYENESLKNFIVKKEYTESELLKLLNVNNISINNIIRNDTNHVDKIIIDNKSFSGVEFRKLLNLRSTDFEIIKNNNNYIITTRGYGHGVGMSQYGANEMAKKGYNYQDIINHYYQNTELIKI